MDCIHCGAEDCPVNCIITLEDGIGDKTIEGGCWLKARSGGLCIACAWQRLGAIVDKKNRRGNGDD